MSNHLWQSTVFAVLAGLLTLALRKNRAAVRYWVWFTASIKFLIPFSVLLALGGYVETLRPTPPRSLAPPIRAAYTTAIVEITSPFPDNPVRARSINWIAVVWAIGSGCIVLMRLRGWLRIRALLRNSLVWDSRSCRLSLPRLEIRSTAGLIEPGVVGLLKPTLLLPEGIEDHLTPQQFDAILAHELRHARRRDNLTAAVHMLVETIFWFHPVVWWIGARLLEERERACDEAVLSQGSDPQDYAEGILTICKFYSASPLSWVSGVTGSNLKKRIEAIMANRAALRLSLTKKAMVVVVGIAALFLSLTVRILAATPKFEVASVKAYKDENGGPRNSAIYGPQGINFGGLTLAFVIGEAYNFPVGRIQGPGSLTKEALWAPLREAYDIAAKADEPVPKDRLRLMLQSLLADRFKLVLHRDAKPGSIYALLVAKGGPKLERSQVQAAFLFHAAPKVMFSGTQS